MIATHDFGGEYGHPDHKALAYATAAAWDLAAGNIATVNLMRASKVQVTSPDRKGGDKNEHHIRCFPLLTQASVLLESK